MELRQEIDDFLALSPESFHGGVQLRQMRELMGVLGDPQNDLKVIHIAGTSGKTSTCYMIAALLKELGKTSLLTVSPHVDTIRERAMLDLAVLPWAEWEREMREFLNIVKSSGKVATYFEFYMAFAFWLAAKRKVDYMVVETGIGGRYDASNVAERADKIAVLTDIGLDHMELLGGTLAKIADEKLGIVKAGNVLLLNRQGTEVMSGVLQVAETQGSELVVLESEEDEFWARNFALAKATVEMICRRETEAGHCPALTAAKCQRAYAVRVPARAEKIEYSGREVILDASHNPQKLGALVRHLKKDDTKRRILVVTLGENKILNAEASLRVMRELADEIILTSFGDNDSGLNCRKSLPLADLEMMAKKAGFLKIYSEADVKKALDFACQLDFDQVVVTGSFYILNDLRSVLFGEEANA